MLPGISGIDLCRRLRQQQQQLPVLMLTARNDIHDRVTGLDAGADDYLTDIKEYLDNIHLVLTIGIIIGCILGILSWYLAGLAMRPLFQSYQQMQQFTADAAHELRTPIATLQVIIENGRAEY